MMLRQLVILSLCCGCLFAEESSEIFFTVQGQVEAERDAVESLIPKRIRTRIDWLIDHGAWVKRGDALLRWGTKRSPMTWSIVIKI